MSDEKVVRARDSHDVGRYGQAKIEAGQVSQPGLVVTNQARPAAPGGSGGSPQAATIPNQPAGSNAGSEPSNAKK